MLSKLSSNSLINQYYDKLNSLYLDLSDLSDSFKKDFLNDNFDASRIDYLSNEITMINRLKRKYNTNNLLEYKNKLKNEIELYNNYEIEISKLSKNVKISYENALKEAAVVSNIRKQYAKELSCLVINELKDLYLPDCLFEVNFNEASLNNNGIDEVEFYMSTNIGVPSRPLIKVASGGEVSRIMLGLKSVFTKLAMVDIIIFDEIGRGTSTYDGMALAQSIIEYIACKIQAFTLFSTHYHELTRLEGSLPGLKNISVGIHEENDKVTFLYKIIEEPANKSYGINVARLAHLPNDLLNRAQQILNELEKNKVVAKDIEYKVEEENKEDELITKLKEIDPLSLNPMEALNLLYELNKEAKKKK